MKYPFAFLLMTSIFYPGLDYGQPLPSDTLKRFWLNDIQLSRGLIQANRIVNSIHDLTTIN